MGGQFENFRNRLQAKIDDADKRVKDLEASLKNAGDKAKSDAKAQLVALDTRAKEQQAKVQAARANMKVWLDNKKATTNDKIAEWKAQRRVKELAEHATISEDYAAAATEVAAAMIDEAEKAIAEAVIARSDADTAQAAPAAKSA